MEQKKQHIVDIVFVLCLFCVFAILSLFIVVMGASVYKGISKDMTANYNARSSLTYLTEKIRQNDSASSVEIGTLGGETALVLTEVVQDREYETWIYVSDGALYEVAVTAGTQVSLGDGQMVTELSDFEIERLDDHLMRIRAVDLDGNTFETMLHTKSAIIGMR